MTRDQWRLFYRAGRVARRESLKALNDLLCYGTGVLLVSDKRSEISVEHVPINEWLRWPPKMVGGEGFEPPTSSV